jgi:hypothetical protein
MSSDNIPQPPIMKRILKKISEMMERFCFVIPITV